jgi:3-hydroxyisobutyrate dehydrogenase
MHPSFVRLSSTTARASTIGFIGLGRMGYEMALNVFSKTMVNHDLQRQTNESTLGSSSNVLPRFAVCDVNEDAANNIASMMRERFPGVNIAIRRTPAEYVHSRICSFLTELSVRIAASASTVITMLPSSPHVQVSSTVDSKPHLRGSSMTGRLPKDVGLHRGSTRKAAQR